MNLLTRIIKVVRLQTYNNILKSNSGLNGLKKQGFYTGINFYDKIVQVEEKGIQEIDSELINKENQEEDIKEEEIEHKVQDVKQAKIKKERIEITLDEKDIIEKFIKGSGNGGQAINKTNSRVELKHMPTGIVIQCQKTRSQSENRKIARKLLKVALDDHFNKEMSKRNVKAKKINKQKSKQAKRARMKYQNNVQSDKDKDKNRDKVE